MGSTRLPCKQKVVRSFHFYSQVNFPFRAFLFLTRVLYTVLLLIFFQTSCHWQRAVWCIQHLSSSQQKKSRNAKISHQQNPALSDAVLFFLHVLETDTYIHFDFKRSLYSHFQQLLQVPGKALLLDDKNFAAKANPSRTYLPCNIDTSNLFDEDGDPIFVAQSEPASPMPAAGRKCSKKPNTGAKTSTGLKRKLGTASSKL